MKKLLLTSSFLLILFSVNAQETEVEVDSNHFYWTEDAKLHWSDFQGKVEESSNLAALATMALPYKFETEVESKIDFTIQVYFIKSDSWAKKEEENDLLLKHQQLHFDIAELHRRKVVKELINSEINSDNYKATLKQIVGRFWGDEYPKMQNQYDDDSNFSQNIKGQIEWIKFVKEELEKLHEYQSTNFTLNLNSIEE